MLKQIKNNNILNINLSFSFLHIREFNKYLN